MSETPLDRAHARMIERGEDEDARRAFFAAVAATDLVAWLEAEPAPGAAGVRPMIAEIDGGQVALAFDTEARLAEFVGGPAAVATLPGRELAALLAAEGVSLALNPEVAPSAILLPPEALSWIGEAAPVAQTAAARIAGIAPPDAPAALLDALSGVLPGLAGRARRAALARARFDDGTEGLVLALEGVAADQQPAVGAALAEALGRAGLGAQALSVLFPAEGAEIMARIARTGLSAEVPAPAAAPGTAPPGTDPDRPPRLR